MTRMLRRGLSRMLPVLGAATLVGGLIVCLLQKATSWLRVEIPLNRADWIVVLGRESGQRVIGAAEAYHRGIAGQVFVSGAGDCTLIVRRLRMAGVSAIRSEYRSGSTYENTTFTRKELESDKPQKILPITSWYHTRRALHTFEKEWPGVTFGIHGVHPGTRLGNRFMLYEAGSILAEYIKTVWYALRYGIFWSCRFMLRTGGNVPNGQHLSPEVPATLHGNRA